MIDEQETFYKRIEHIIDNMETTDMQLPPHLSLSQSYQARTNISKFINHKELQFITIGTSGYTSHGLYRNNDVIYIVYTSLSDDIFIDELKWKYISYLYLDDETIEAMCVRKYLDNGEQKEVDEIPHTA